jgi:DNA-binding transcriptional LysR family regulator
MDEHRLKCFAAVYELGSVSAAAVRLHMTQPPLSMLLRKLEDELGVQLFDRSSKRLVPTEVGQLFYVRARAMLANMESTRRELRKVERGAGGVVNIGCPTAGSLFVIPSVMEEVKHECAIHVHEGEAGLMLQRLRERSLDLLISRSRLHAPEMEVCPILHEPLLVALPPAHPLGQRHSIRLEELKGERFLIHRSSADSGLHEVEMQACQQAGFVPNVVYLGGETIPMLLMVQQGLGVAFAPYSFAKLQLAQQMHMVPLEEPVLTTCLNLIWSKQHVLAPAAERVRRFVVQTFGST